MEFLATSATLICAALSLLVSLWALFVSRRSAKRESYSSAREILTDLTTGETAQARDLLGAVRYGDDSVVRTISYSDVIKQYYVLEWALERVGYSYLGLRPAGESVQDSVRDALQWHLKELITALEIFHLAFPRSMYDADSWDRIKRVQNDLKIPVSAPREEEIDTVRDRINTLRAQG